MARGRRWTVGLAVAISLVAGTAVATTTSAAPPTPPTSACTPRLLILAAMPSEIDKLLVATKTGRTVVRDSRTFYEGKLAGANVALALSGIGLLNAEATTKAALAAFRCGKTSSLTGVVFSGVAGGRANIGDVAVPSRWAIKGTKSWLRTDPAMLAVARKTAPKAQAKLLQTVPLGDPACGCIDPDAVRTVTMPNRTRVLVGGDGVSTDPFNGRRLPCIPGGGDVFGCEPCRGTARQVPDLAGFVSGARPFVDPTFITGYFAEPTPPGTPYDAEDMESAAVAQVAAKHRLPFIAFRAVSDGSGDPLGLPGFPAQFFYYRKLAADNAAIATIEFLHAWSARR